MTSRSRTAVRLLPPHYLILSGESDKLCESGDETITGVIFNIQRYSVNDGPGIRTTVFLKGCPLHCPWCHNPESLSTEKDLALRPERCIRCGVCFATCKNHAVHKDDGTYTTIREKCLKCGDCIELCVADGRVIFGEEVTTEEVLGEIKKDVVFYRQSGGGASFSGGEPLLQHEFLSSLLEACKLEGIHTTVDTTGYTSPSILERVAASTDLFLYDIKTLDDDLHRQYTGVSNQRILANLRLLAGWKKDIIVRVPVIPGINDNEISIRAISIFVGHIGSVRELHLLPYHESGVEKYHRLGLEYAMKSVSPPRPEKLELLMSIARHYVPTVSAGG